MSYFCYLDPETVNSPLQALSKLVPVPESLMSPDYRPSPLVARISTPSTIPTPVNKNVVKPMQNVKSPKMNSRAVASKPKNTLLNDNKKNCSSPTPPRQRKQMNSHTR